MSPLQLHIDLRPGVFHLVSQSDQPIEDADEDKNENDYDADDNPHCYHE
jgi:hypothetical protein